MFCPNCKVEYRFGFTHCTDCDVDLVESLEEVSEVRRLEPLYVTHDPELLGEILEALEHEGVPYVIRAGTALALTEDEPLQDEGRPDRWEARISVLGSAHARAMDLLTRVRAARDRLEPLIPPPREDHYWGA